MNEDKNTENHAINTGKEELVPQEYEIRLQKVKELRSLGIEPWAAPKKITATAHEILEKYQDGQEAEYAIAGRVMTIRLHGKSAFAHVQDESGTIQVYVKQDAIGDSQFEIWNKFIDMGDIVWFKGSAFKTKTGEVTLKVTEFTLLSKCLYPLPEKFHGLVDTEVRYRQRYLDLITNPESRQKFKVRSHAIRAIREFLDNNGYMEVETPMLHPIAGGALARPFITHHNALDSDFYLRIAPELYLKRLVVGGYEKVYEINRNFRNEGISTRHNPEFTMLEFYTAHRDYHYIMDFVEDLLRTVMQKSCGTLQVSFGERMIDFAKPFARFTAKEAVMKFGHYNQEKLAPEHIDAILATVKHELDLESASYGEKLFALFEAVAEHQLFEPTFIIDYPIEISPLAKRSPDNPEVASRFELFMCGFEVANGFNELSDPLDQAQRFKDQLKMRQVTDQGLHEYDADFVHALDYGMPPTVGVGIGIDRLVMLLTNTSSIKDVILFPTLKKKA